MLDLLFRGRRVVLESPLSLQEATERLHSSVSAPSWRIAPENSERPFEGTFSDGRFHLMRSVRGRNSFRAVIDGTLARDGSGVRVNVRLRLHPLVAVFCLVLLACIAPLVLIAAMEFARTRELSPPTLVAAAFPVVFVVFAIVSRAEARLATRMLADLFEARTVAAGTGASSPQARR